MELPSGSVIDKMNTKRASSLGYYTKDTLAKMNLEVVEEPVAYNIRRDKSTVYFYDKKTTVRMPLMCVKCGSDVRFKKKLCRSCYICGVPDVCSGVGGSFKRGPHGF